MTGSLSPYEDYYQQVGLQEYSVVFERNDEKPFEAKLCADFLTTWTKRQAQDLRVLDIGCGLGAFTCHFLQALYLDRRNESDKPRVNIDLVDINPTAFDLFGSMARNVDSCIVSVDRCICDAWQDVHARESLDRYDLVIANHSLYGCAIDQDLVQSLQNVMSPDSRTLVALVARDSNLLRMRVAAGIANNGCEDFESAINDASCDYARLAYYSKFRYSHDDNRYMDWFFAGGNVGDGNRKSLLAEYGDADSISPFIPNKASIYVLQQS